MLQLSALGSRAARQYCCALLLSCLALSAHAERNIEFARRSAAEVLQAYERLGFAFIYSSDVLPAQNTFAAEPAPGTPIARLREALQQFGVTLRVADHNRRWLIVPLADTQGVGTRSSGVPRVQRTSIAMATPLLEELIVVASRYALTREASGATELDALQLEALPELGDDSLRAVNHVPGVASLGLSAQPHIRGGDVDESLVLLDGMELLAPFHLRSFNSVFSGLHPGTIDSIDVYTGAFPVRYGGRIGGVLDIATRADVPDIGGEFALSPFTTAAVLAGSSTQDGQEQSSEGSNNEPATQRAWLLAARRGNLSDVARAVDPSVGAPKYADGYGELRWQRGARQLAIGALVWNDDTRLREYGDEGRGAEIAGDDSNRYAWTRLTSEGDDWRAVTRVFVTDVRHERVGRTTDEDADESVGTLDEYIRFRRWAVEQTYSSVTASDAVVEFGLSVRQEDAHLRAAIDVERGELAELLAVPTEVQRTDRVALERLSYAGYGSLRSTWTDALSTELGLRIDGERYAGDGPDGVGISPRMSVRYDFAAGTQVRIAAGHFRQAQGLHELQITDGERRLQQPQTASHLVLGFEHRFETWQAQLHGEAFLKRIQHPKRRYENLYDALQLVPELGPDRVQIASERARARGIELQLSVQPSPELGAWVSYANARSEDRIAGKWTPRTWDQRQTVQAGVLWTPARWTVSAALTWHNGWRTTRLPTQIAELEPQSLRRNGSPLPDFLSLDVRASRMWVSERQSFILFAEITNLTNHNNVGATNHGFANEDEDVRPIQLEVERERLVPFVPSIGFIWRFQ